MIGTLRNSNSLCIGVILSLSCFYNTNNNNYIEAFALQTWKSSSAFYLPSISATGRFPTKDSSMLQLAATTTTTMRTSEQKEKITQSEEKLNFSNKLSSAILSLVDDSTEIRNLSFRQLLNECRARGLEVSGTTATLRKRLAEVLCPPNDTECVIEAASDNDDSTEQGTLLFNQDTGITFNEEDIVTKVKRLEMEIQHKCNIGHWKTAVRKLKHLRSILPSTDSSHSHDPSLPSISEETYTKALLACAADRLSGARASVSARKIMEEMVDSGYTIPSDIANTCIVDSLSGKGPDATHDGFGGIDVALAMLSAMEASNSPVKEATLVQLITALLENTSSTPSPSMNDAVASSSSSNNIYSNLEDAISLIRKMVVNYNFTPTLALYAAVADKIMLLTGNSSSSSSSDAQLLSSSRQLDMILQLLTLTKAAGYELDSIASAEAGRELLAAGVVVAERANNLALGLRLLTAAMKAQGCAPERGDRLVATLSKPSQRASALLHIRSIDMAVKEDNWKLAVKLLQLMPERGLVTPSNVWRKVVTVCAKAEKSRKATQLLLDWVKLYEEQQGNFLYNVRLQKPPLSVFNTVINTCEICGEEELTLKVLDSMKQTHQTEGNIITFNIALKRLAKLGNSKACEGIIIGMLQAGTEPNVVSYTTAIAACASSDVKDSAFAYEWLKRMKSRNVQPNIFSYNTALATCLDGKLESTIRGSTIAAEMLADIERVLLSSPSSTNTTNQSPLPIETLVPDSYTKALARNLMKQLRSNWRSGDIDMAQAKATLRVPLLKLVDFDLSQKMQAAINNKKFKVPVEDPNCYDEELAMDEECTMHEVEIDYAIVQKIHREGARVAEV